MWVEFVAGSLPCSERFFFAYSGFPSPQKTNTSKFQFNLECTDTSMSSQELLSASRVNKLHFFYYNFTIYSILEIQYQSKVHLGAI